MAIQGVPTLADIDFGAIRQSRELNFKQKVLSDLKKMTVGKTASLSWDGKKLKFNPGASKKMTDTELWNFYTSKSEAAGVPVDVTFYETQLKPFYSQDSTAKLKEDIGSLGMQNIPESAWKKLYKDNPNYQQALIQTIQSSTPEEASILQGYTYAQDTEGLVQGLIDSPLTTVGGIGLTAAGAKTGFDFLKGTKLGQGLLSRVGKLGPLTKATAPAFAAGLVEPIARGAGATEDEATAIRGITTGLGAGLTARSIGKDVLTSPAAKKVAKKGLLKMVGAGLQATPDLRFKALGGGLLALDAFLAGKELFGSDEE